MDFGTDGTIGFDFVIGDGISLILDWLPLGWLWNLSGWSGRPQVLQGSGALFVAFEVEVNISRSFDRPVREFFFFTIDSTLGGLFLIAWIEFVNIKTWWFKSEQDK